MTAHRRPYCGTAREPSLVDPPKRSRIEAMTSSPSMRVASPERTASTRRRISVFQARSISLLDRVQSGRWGPLEPHRFVRSAGSAGRASRVGRGRTPGTQPAPLPSRMPCDPTLGSHRPGFAVPPGATAASRHRSASRSSGPISSRARWQAQRRARIAGPAAREMRSPRSKPSIRPVSARRSTPRRYTGRS